jgi:hypothetical protein
MNQNYPRKIVHLSPPYRPELHVHVLGFDPPKESI